MMINVGKTLPFLPPTGHGNLGKPYHLSAKMVMTGGCFFVHIGLPLFGG